MRRRSFLATLPAGLVAASRAPDKTIVLTFDDAVKSHRTFVAPFLQELGLRASFFVSQRWMGDRANFMTWDDIAAVHGMGFEIGNHTWTHAHFYNAENAVALAGELSQVEAEMARAGVPKPVSFAWP
ncbi:MAG: polysaccharide deacetylase family protein, partial [Bryobacteraceae bacterium]